MRLYKFFSCNVEVQYKSHFMSKAMLFTFITTILNLVLPFLIAYRSRGFWLKSYNFYEQPAIQFNYDYLLIAETEDPNFPLICGDAPFMKHFSGEENCSQFQVQQIDKNSDSKNDVLNYKFEIKIPKGRVLTNILLLLSMDFQFTTVCPLHMQSLTIVDKEFAIPPSAVKHYADLSFYQTVKLPCFKNHVDTKYNSSLLHRKDGASENMVDNILFDYFKREVSLRSTNVYSRSLYGHTSTFELEVLLRVPEMKIRYKPSFMQELKWAWPQYLSLVIIFYWIFDKIKRFVFNNRLVMAWEVVPWKSK